MFGRFARVVRFTNVKQARPLFFLASTTLTMQQKEEKKAKGLADAEEIRTLWMGVADSLMKVTEKLKTVLDETYSEDDEKQDAYSAILFGMAAADTKHLPEMMHIIMEQHKKFGAYPAVCKLREQRQSVVDE
jgi:hypothetical protein